MLYESFVHPLTVLTTLPPATLGGLFTLWIFGLPLSMYSYLGIILLIGIVKKNGIMMIDFALDNIRTKGMAPREAIYDAALVRFRPIMMTTVSRHFWSLADCPWDWSKRRSPPAFGISHHRRFIPFPIDHALYHSEPLPCHGKN